MGQTCPPSAGSVLRLRFSQMKTLLGRLQKRRHSVRRRIRPIEGNEKSLRLISYLGKFFAAAVYLSEAPSPHNFCMYFIQKLLILPPPDSTELEDDGIDPMTVATLALAVRRSNHSARSHPKFFIFGFPSNFVEFGSGPIQSVKVLQCMV